MVSLTRGCGSARCSQGRAGVQFCTAKRNPAPPTKTGPPRPPFGLPYGSLRPPLTSPLPQAFSVGVRRGPLHRNPDLSATGSSLAPPRARVLFWTYRPLVLQKPAKVEVSVENRSIRAKTAGVDFLDESVVLSRGCILDVMEHLRGEPQGVVEVFAGGLAFGGIDDHPWGLEGWGWIRGPGGTVNNHRAWG